jgi:type IV pilus assembly protein PilN
VILINLLPHREERRAQRKRAFFVGLGAAAIAGLAVVGIWFTVVQQMIAGQQSRNNFLKAEIARLDAQIKDIANLRAEIDALKARQKAVEDLQTDRNLPVHLLSEFVKQTPEGVYLTAIRQNGQLVNVTGFAQTNERVSEFLRNTLYNSTWLEKPELIEIKASNVGGRDARRLSEFQMRVTLKRPQAPAPGAAPGAPAAPGAAAATNPAPAPAAARKAP